MPREPHPDTRPQRADDPNGADPHAAALGYEPSDAPPRGVTMALTLAWLLLIGGGIAASATVHLVGGVRRAVDAPAVTPPPRLLADPAAERRAIEAEQRSRRDPAREAAARRQLIAKGWPGDSGAPGRESE